MYPLLVLSARKRIFETRLHGFIKKNCFPSMQETISYCKLDLDLTEKETHRDTRKVMQPRLQIMFRGSKLWECGTKCSRKGSQKERYVFSLQEALRLLRKAFFPSFSFFSSSPLLSSSFSFSFQWFFLIETRRDLTRDCKNRSCSLWAFAFEKLVSCPRKCHPGWSS